MPLTIGLRLVRHDIWPSIGPSSVGSHIGPPHEPQRGGVLVVVPTYNERENLPLLVRVLMTHAGYRVMVVDDGSPDGTGTVADLLAEEFPRRVDVRHRTGKRGLGRSYVEGLGRALGDSADVICQMDVDL